MDNKFKEWLKCATIRAIRTMAQTSLGCLGSAVVITEVNWKYVLAAAILSGIASYLTSIAGLPEVPSRESDLSVNIVDDEEVLQELKEASDE